MLVKKSYGYTDVEFNTDIFGILDMPNIPTSYCKLEWLALVGLNKNSSPFFHFEHLVLKSFQLFVSFYSKIQLVNFDF